MVSSTPVRDNASDGQGNSAQRGANANSDASNSGELDETKQRELARKVAERVWELWRDELRHDRQRRGR